MQRTTACSLSYFQPISRLRDLPNKFLASRAEKSAIVRAQSARKGPRCRKKCDRASFSPLKTRTIALFSAAGALFPKRTGQPRPRRSEETFPEPAPCEAPPPTGTPADASPGYVPQTYLTGASYERALRKREGKAQLAQRAKANRTPRGSIPWPSSRGRTMRPARSEEAFSSPALPGKTGRTQ